MAIYVSGVHSDINPSSGLGIARSIRTAYPAVHLVAVDYSSRSSGLHGPEFDEVWIQRPWDELDLASYSAQVRELLESGSLWISGLDLEIVWLSQTLGSHPNLLVPSEKALDMVAKPDIAAHQALPFRLPPFVPAFHSDNEIHAFCRAHDWRVWLKGPYHDAYRARSWEDVTLMRAMLSDQWSTDRIFLQADVLGREESIAFSAYHGALLDCVYISKRSVTSEGKTWAARVSEVPMEVLEPLRNLIEELSWTGGAELEFVRDVSDAVWLIDWNPRFPAWIYGATLAGHNMPALLVQSATGVQSVKEPSVTQEFTRIVLEIPCRRDFPLPPLPEPSMEFSVMASKHPSSMLKLARQLSTANRQSVEDQPRIPDEILEEIDVVVVPNLETPCRLQLCKATSKRFAHLSSAASRLSSSKTAVEIAYSIKTNPDMWLLETAFRSEMLAEAISQMEVAKALSVGFPLDRIVLNGPGKWWPAKSHDVEDYGFVFADSLEELGTYRGLPVTRLGIRLRLPPVNSRFGVPLAPYESFQRLVSVISDLPPDCPLGLHFHLASCELGIRRWWHLYDSFIGWARTIENTTSREVCCLDIGGGWFPDDAVRLLIPNLKKALAKAEQALPNLRQFYWEPGRALTQSTSILAVRILEVRRPCSDQMEVVVDGAISDLPLIRAFPHRILAQDERHEWQLLGRGENRILGRSCMENDILANEIRIPGNARAGDILVICDAGAYDRSMSYEFGQG